MKNFNFELFNFVDKYWQTNEKTKTFVNPVDQFLSRKSLKTIPSTSNGATWKAWNMKAYTQLLGLLKA